MVLIGYEFLGILLLLIYTSGIAIIFIITSMILGTKHIGLLMKPPSISEEEDEEREDEVSRITNKLIFFLIYFSFLILVFFIFNFPNGIYNFLLNFLISGSNENFLTSNIVLQLNDPIIIGFLIYQQYFIYTVIAALTLLVSLLGSIYISQDKKK
jgi:NADH:ubiquinone oxidoreductase subunit 6 (subunit J)